MRQLWVRHRQLRSNAGSILGLLYGRDGIPDEWVELIGHRAVTRPQFRGFPAPDDLGELTDWTLAMARMVLAAEDLPARIEPEGRTAVPDGTLEGFVVPAAPDSDPDPGRPRAGSHRENV